MGEMIQQLEKPSLFIFLVSSMLATGLGLGVRTILAPLRDVRMVLIALVLNFACAPAIAWLLSRVIPLQQGHAVGLLLLGGAAGAPFLPTLVKMAHTDEAFASALMVLSTLGTILFIPLVLPFFIAGLDTSAWEIAGPLLWVMVAPLLAGLFIRSFAPSFATRTAHVLSGVGNTALLLFFVLLLGRNIPALLSLLGSGAIAAALLFFVLLFVAGWFLGGSGLEVKGSMALCATARNFGAAFIPATGSLRDPGVSIMLTVSAVIGLITSFLAARWLRRRTAAHQPAFGAGLRITKL